jgi:hypothetical protein
MVDDVSQQIENAVNTIVSLTDKSGNLKKELNKSIHETVSNLRNLIFILKSNLLKKTEENNKTRNEVKQLKDTLEKWKSTPSTSLAAPSVTSNTVLTSCAQRSTLHLAAARGNCSPKSCAGKVKSGTH